MFYFPRLTILACFSLFFISVEARLLTGNSQNTVQIIERLDNHEHSLTAKNQSAVSPLFPSLLIE